MSLQTKIGIGKMLQFSFFFFFHKTLFEKADLVFFHLLVCVITYLRLPLTSLVSVEYSDVD